MRGGTRTALVATEYTFNEGKVWCAVMKDKSGVKFSAPPVEAEGDGEDEGIRKAKTKKLRRVGSQLNFISKFRTPSKGAVPVLVR